MKKIGLIGSVCLDRTSSSGQAIRTTILYNVLTNRYGRESIYLVNTHNKNSQRFKTILDSIKCILMCKDIIVMVSSNGRRMYYPILFLSSKFLRKRVYNNVIGGNFAEYVKTTPKAYKYVASFKVNWIQMRTQVNELKELGVQNAELLQNTKEVKALTKDEIKPYNDTIFRFCTFSRISVAKGIENAIETIERINRNIGKTIVTLDIYGIPDDDYASRFEEVMKSTSASIKYCGYINYNNSIETLKDYYALLFPTVFFGEGFPGTVWDALASGVPTIATDWRYNSEVVIENKTGFLYDYKKPDLLEDRIMYAINHVDMMNEMKINCIHEAEKYAPETVFSVIYKHFD